MEGAFDWHIGAGHELQVSDVRHVFQNACCHQRLVGSCGRLDAAGNDERTTEQPVSVNKHSSSVDPDTQTQSAHRGHWELEARDVPVAGNCPVNGLVRFRKRGKSTVTRFLDNTPTTGSRLPPEDAEHALKVIECLNLVAVGEGRGSDHVCECNGPKRRVWLVPACRKLGPDFISAHHLVFPNLGYAKSPANSVFSVSGNLYAPRREPSVNRCSETSIPA
jgi:hypothetical protein